MFMFRCGLWYKDRKIVLLHVFFLNDEFLGDLYALILIAGVCNSLGVFVHIRLPDSR